MDELDEQDIDVNMFFALERNVSFKFAALVSDINEMQKVVLNNRYDISRFVSKLSHVFMPSVVYQLEEYCLPRMISKKLCINGVIEFNIQELTLHKAIEAFNTIGKQEIISKGFLSSFEEYILNYFYEGITLEAALMKE